MRAIILAAGRGTRMGTLTDEKPKCLLEINGETLLEKQITTLYNSGIKQISIVTGYKSDIFEDCDVLNSYNVTEFHNPRWEETSMVYSLKCASSWLISEPCIISYSDIFYEYSAVKIMIGSKGDLAVLYSPNWLKLWEKRFDDPLLDAESFKINRGIVHEIGKKPTKLSEIYGQYMGILKITPTGWNEFARVLHTLRTLEQDQISMTGMLQKIIESQMIRIIGYPYYGTWGEIDTERDLELWNK